MVKSMTGFGLASVPVGEGSIQVEVKTLNSKFLDLSLRLPKIFSEKEIEIRNLLTENLERGKVSVIIEHNKTSQGAATLYKEDAFIAHYAELKKLADRVMAPYEPLFEIALRSSEVQQGGDAEKLDATLYERLLAAMKEALKQCNSFREAEGAVIGRKCRGYIHTIEDYLKQVEALDPLRINKIRSRMTQNVSEFFSQESFDANRLEQELLFYVEKLDIHEERVRLKTHLDYFVSVMNEPQSNGKKLAFISQEIGREVNTIGSKANDAGMQKEVVNMKEELEKIKEQLNNVL